MGGIPYQSPGCTSCRKRKVRVRLSESLQVTHFQTNYDQCDLGKPQCMRCIKRKVPCPGYEKDRIFLHQVAPPTSSDQQIQYIGRARPFILSPAVSAGPALRSQMVSTFLDASFPVNLGFSDKIDVLPSLVVNISTRPVKSEMLERALSAVSCIYLGRINQDENLIHTGVGHYDMAIRYMSFMLYHRFQTDDMIYTTVIFQLLQV